VQNMTQMFANNSLVLFEGYNEPHVWYQVSDAEPAAADGGDVRASGGAHTPSSAGCRPGYPHLPLAVEAREPCGELETEDLSACFGHHPHPQKSSRLPAPAPHMQASYGGDSIYFGYQEMLDAYRSGGANNLLIVAGHQDYAFDPSGNIAFHMQYMRDHNGSAPSNVVYNLHPYEGGYGSTEKSIRSTLRTFLALKTVAPVVFTELGQYCCNSNSADYQTCQGTGMCTDHEHGDWYVHNLLNLATEYDISWVGWGWRGRNSPSKNCTQGMTQCNTPDMVSSETQRVPLRDPSSHKSTPHRGPLLPSSLPPAA
jgi:hypothetical protein